MMSIMEDLCRKSCQRHCLCATVATLPTCPERQYQLVISLHSGVAAERPRAPHCHRIDCHRDLWPPTDFQSQPLTQARAPSTSRARADSKIWSGWTLGTQATPPRSLLETRSLAAVAFRPRSWVSRGRSNLVHGPGSAWRGFWRP